jgi:hypothetical protein
VTKVETDKYKAILDEVKDEKVAGHLWLKWKCLTDLFFLGYEILGLKEAKDKRGRRIVDPVFHSWLAGVLNTSEDVMCIVPRRFMKTTWVKIKLIQNILRDPFVRQALYSSTSDLVEQELLSIKRMAASPKLMALFPEVLVDPGEKGLGYQINRANQLTIWRDPKIGAPPQEAQIEAFGIGGNPVGKHFDVHIYDDIVTDKNSQTMEQLNKTREWYGYIQGVLEPGGQEIYIGTPYHYEDLTNFIQKEGIFERVYKRSYQEGGKIIYSYFTEKMMERIRKKMTPYQFSCQYECNPQPIEDQIFPPPQPTFTTLPPGKYVYYIAVDPAATTQSYSDETAIVVGAVNEISHLYVVEAYHFKKSGDEIAEIILKLNEQYSPRRIGIEFGLQEHLRHVLDLTKSNWENIQRKPISLPIESIKVSKDRSKFKRIELTAGSFIRSRRMWIQDRLIDLIKQMGLYNKNYSGKDDLVDALSMLFSVVEQFSFRYWKDPLGLVKKGVIYFEDLFKKKAKGLGYNERFVQ